MYFLKPAKKLGKMKYAKTAKLFHIILKATSTVPQMVENFDELTNTFQKELGLTDNLCTNNISFLNKMQQPVKIYFYTLHSLSLIVHVVLCIIYLSDH